MSLNKEWAFSFVFTRISVERKLVASEEDKAVVELWPLKDAVLFDGSRVASLGRVVHVDGSLVAVQFNPKRRCIPETHSTGVSTHNALSNCRLLRKDELVV